MRQSVRKTFLFFVSALFVVMAMLSIAACTPKEVTLTFDTDGGSTIAPITAEIGAEITPPSAPEKEGFVFDGWYLTADRSGESVTLPTVMPEKNTTYYAKFSELPKATLTLDAAQGTLSATSYQLAVGENVATFLSNVKPVAEGLEFGGWFTENGRLLSDTQVMPASGLKLTARYKVGYTVEIYLQNTEGDGYTKDDSATLTGSDWIGAAINRTTANVTVPTGYRFNSSLSPELVLTETASANLYRAHFDRSTYNVFYLGNEPQGTTAEGSMEKVTVRDGAVITVKENEYVLDGYRFAGWATSSTGSVVYQPGEELEVSGNMQFYACWNFGLSDLNGGADKLYVLQERDGAILLERNGLDDKIGEYNGQTRVFTFTTDAGTRLSGRISADGKTFVYLDDSIATTYQQYDLEASAVVSEVTLKLDAVGGAIYQNGTQTVNGTYEASDAGYAFTPNGEGESFYFALTEIEGVNVFVIGDGAQGAYNYMDANGSIYYYPAILLDGFGNAAVLTSATAQPIYATYTVTEDGIVRIEAEEDDVLYCMILTVETTTGSTMTVFVSADEYVGAEFTVKTENGTISLALDGFGGAVYTDENGTEHETVYQISDGYLDGESKWTYVLFLTENSEAGKVLAIRFDENGVKEAELTTYSVFAEYGAKSGYTARLRMNDGVATIELLLKSGEYQLVVTGVYEEEEDGAFFFTATEFVEDYRGAVEGIYDSFRFGLFNTGSSYVFVISDGYEGTYTFTVGGSNVTLEVSGYGFADLIVDENEAVSVSYSVATGYADENGNWAFLSFVNGQNTYVIRFDLNGKAATTVVDIDYAINQVFADLNNRIKDYTESLRLYPDGTAIISVVEDGEVVATVKGKYAPDAELDGFFTFTADVAPAEEFACYTAFRFTVVSQGSANYYFCYYNEDEVLSIEQGDVTLSLSGYGIATYNGKQYLYDLDGSELVLVTPSGSETVIVRLGEDGKSFVASGAEMGSYYPYVNGTLSFEDYIVTLDGFGNAALSVIVEGDEEAGTQTEIVLVAEGTYTVQGAEITVSFPDSEYEGFSFITGQVSILGIAFPVYLKADEELVANYSIVGGGAIAVDQYGNVTYTDAIGDTYTVRIRIVTDPYDETRTLLAMYNSSGTTLAAIYLVDGESLQVLDNLYGRFNQLIGASISGSSYLVLDGLGGAKLVDGEGTVIAVGTYAESETIANNYVFTSLTEGVDSFVFGLSSVTSTSGTDFAVYIIYHAEWNVMFVSKDWEVIALDGYGMATYTDSYGVVGQTYYEVVENEDGETLVGLFDFETGEYVYYSVDLENGTFEAIE